MASILAALGGAAKTVAADKERNRVKRGVFMGYFLKALRQII